MKKALLLAALACIVGGLLLFRLTGFSIDATTARALLADMGPWGPLVLILALAGLLVIPVLPASALQIAAGLAFGPLFGLVYVLVADVLGASAGFWLARRWGDSVLVQYLSPDQRAQLLRLTARMNWRTIMLLRLLPGPAYPLVSFAAGASPMSFATYTLASFGGVLPSLALLVLAGDIVTHSPLLAFALVAGLVGSLAVAGHFFGRAAAGDPLPETSGEP